VLALSHDGSKLAYIASNRMYLRRMAESSAQPIVVGDANATSQPYSPIFSPDGDSLAFLLGAFPQRATIKTIAPTGGVASTVAELAYPMGMTWGTDGILVSERDKGISRVAAVGGRPESLIVLKPGEVAQRPSMLPGGDVVLFTLASSVTVSAGGPTAADWQNAKIVAQSLRSGERKMLIERASDARYLPTGHLMYASEGVLYATRFDAKSLEVLGKAVPVIEGVQRHVGPPSTATAQADVSDTGTLVYVSGPISLNASAQQLVMIGRDGKAERLKLRNAPYIGPRLSPDAKRIAFGIDEGDQANIWIYELSGDSAPRQLSFGGKNRYPIWSPDGTRIAFQSNREQDEGLFLQRADGSAGAERLTAAEPGVSLAPEAWSPDGKWLLFTAVKGTSHTLRKLSLVDHKVSQFSDVQSLAAPAAAFSPDGRWVVYGRRNQASENMSLFAEPFPPTGAKYLITPNGFRPLWSPDGKEVFFGTRGQSWVVKVKTAPGFTFGNPEQLLFRRYPPLFLGEREYDVMPDGQRFIFAMPTDTATTTNQAREIQLVVNWFEELKARVPTK
jgi:hypothetical protein